MVNERYLTIPELAKFLGVSRSTVYNRVKKVQIPTKKVGRSYIIIDQTIGNILSKKVTRSEKKWIDFAVRKTVQEYGELFKMLTDIDDSFVKSLLGQVLSFRRKPESSVFNWLGVAWTPVFTGETTFYETIID